MSVAPNADLEGRIRGRAAGLQRQFRAMFLRIVAATLVVGLLVSLVLSTSSEKDSRFDAATFALFLASFFTLGALYATLTWWRYRSRVRRLPETMTSGLGEGVDSTRRESMYARGSLSQSTAWENPSVAGEGDFDPNRPPDFH